MLLLCRQSFTMHLLRLMTSWAVVCNVWYLEPQNLRPGETSIEFAERVRDIISVRAGIKKVPWDGYLKYSRPSPKHTERKQQIFAESVLKRLEEK
ncbi:glycerol-3-phosphate acyltransferase 9-like [Telopea speciosissima]|uniref:glycerol-3-phosphate acyltransferase 9-like n=1 Tax=Telopea speciosissima TaxID=54955 RepID=UPI001CC6565B|nr:glycerol-3-phosphate acyltransferase 9-like [Telopea speciosissima]